MHMGLTAVKLETVEVEGHGNTANEVGKYSLQGAGGQVLDTGKYVVIWQQEAGQWKIHRDIWNSSRPASGQ
jgi:ketosteroid isomerase-like protein